MNVEFESIRDKGTDDERIVFRAQANCNIGDYFTFISHYTNVAEKRVSTSVGSPYWFPDQELKKGDYVVLYTKSGVNSNKQNKDGSVSYFFYRGLTSSCCGNENACVILLSVSQWASKGL